MKQWQLFYVLLTFSIGMATLGIVTVVFHKTKEKFIRYYLYFHVAFTLAVFSEMFFLYLHTSLPGISSSMIGLMEYVEDFIVKYALMITLPLFFHEFFAVPHAKTRNMILSALVAMTYVLDHVLGFVAQNEVLKQIGRMLNDTMFTVILLYVVSLELHYLRQLNDPVKKKLATRIVIFVGICLPGIIDELWFHSIFPIPVFPILYSGLSIIFTIHLFTHFSSHASEVNAPSENLPEDMPDVSRLRSSTEALFQHYNISPREQEVVHLVLEGRSNQEIGEALYISLSTVKTHLRNIYQKANVKSRYELMTLFTKTTDRPE